MSPVEALYLSSVPQSGTFWRGNTDMARNVCLETGCAGSNLSSPYVSYDFQGSKWIRIKKD
jgi:hypothetical protein